MTNRIQSIEIQTTRFDPVEAEIAISVLLQQSEVEAELRGRLMGPRCVYNETVEIAYALKPLPREDELLRARVVIPEASFWEPTIPFLYEGPVEVWQGGQRLDGVSVAHGLRHAVLKRQELHLNGRPLKIRGLACNQLAAETAGRLRDAGCNLLLASATAASAGIWEAADRLGFLVLGQIDARDDETLWEAEKHWSQRASCFGWVLPQGLLQQRQLWHNAMSLLHGQRQPQFIGIRLEQLPLGALPGQVSFVVCDESHLPELEETSLPKIVLARRGAAEAPQPESASGVLGWIYREIPEGKAGPA